MKLLEVVLILCLSVTSTFAVTAFNESDFDNNINFWVWNVEGHDWQLNFTFDNNDSFTALCPPSATTNWTIVSHAWKENLEGEEWARSIINSFVKFRGGCVMWMDFDSYARAGYNPMVRNINGIAGTLLRKFRQLDQLGYDPANGWIFANGFASHVAFLASYNYTPCTIGRIDACDPAKPTFLNASEPVQLARYSAKNVICYHTSRAYGTNLRYCQKNINFGRCGIAQPASIPLKYTDHELCPYFYNNTFTVDFDIVPKQTVNDYYRTKCRNLSVVPDLLPGEYIHVGPRMKTCIPNGEYFVLSEKVYPYNVATIQNTTYDYDNTYDDTT